MSQEAYFAAEEEETSGHGEEHLASGTGGLPFLWSGRLPAKASEWAAFRESRVKYLDPLISGTHVDLVHRLRSVVHVISDLRDIDFSPGTAFFETPAPTSALDVLIEKARATILALQEGWDDGEGKAYKAETLGRAASLLNRLAALTLTRHSQLPLPVIRPSEDGSVDLYWSDNNRTLLINVPESLAGAATYSGRRGSGDTTAGTIDLDEGRVSHLASWLTE